MPPSTYRLPPHGLTMQGGASKRRRNTAISHHSICCAFDFADFGRCRHATYESASPPRRWHRSAGHQAHVGRHAERDRRRRIPRPVTTGETISPPYNGKCRCARDVSPPGTDFARANATIIIEDFRASIAAQREFNTTPRADAVCRMHDARLKMGTFLLSPPQHGGERPI